MRDIRMGRRWLSAFVILLVLIGGAPAAFAQGEQVYVVRIMHTNDHHARIEPTDVSGVKSGGVARRKTLVDQIRAETPNTLLLDAGDVFQGTLYFNQYRGQADLYFYNAMKYDAMAIGNHEFDQGPQTLADFIAGATFPVLSANITTDGSSPLAGKFKPWVIKEVGGEKIGIFGLTTEETPILSSPGVGVSFTSHIDAARRSVSELTAQGVNKIIALTHLGFDVDRAMAREVAGIDVIVGGHSHTPLGDEPGAVATYPLVEVAPDGTRVVIVQDWEWVQWLGDISVGFDANGVVTNWQGKPIPLDDSIAADAGFEAKIKEYNAPLEQLRNTPVSQSAVALNGARTDVRTKETNLGNLIADSMLDKTRVIGSQIAITNGGGIRAGIDAGEVTVGEVLTVLPFGNTLAQVDISGALVKEALENGVSQVESVAGRFPQVAGVRFTWNPAAAPGSRVTGIQVADGAGGYKPIDPNATYRVVTNNFMLTGGDGYTAFQKGTNPRDTGFVLADVLTDYMPAHAPVNPAVEGRIVQGTAPAEAPAAPSGPVSLPNTGDESLPAWLLAALGAAAISGGFTLRRRRDLHNVK